MEPLSLILTALVAGIAAGLQPTATQAVKDAYQGVKELIRRKYAKVSIDMLENDPADEARQGIVKKDLQQAGADGDQELLHAAQALLAAIHASEFDSTAARSVGVSLKDIEVGASFKLSNINATGNATGLEIDGAKIEKNLEINGVQAGNSVPKP